MFANVQINTTWIIDKDRTSTCFHILNKNYQKSKQSASRIGRIKKCHKYYPRVPMASLWPNRGNKTNWGNIRAKKYFFSKKYFVIPSPLLSFLPYYCHSFRIFVIPSDFCNSFQIIFIPSVIVSFLSNYLENYKY